MDHMGGPMPRFVGGEGPAPCRIMLIGEGPGWEEEKCGRPFVGKSGKELDRYLWRNLHLGRDQVYVTNMVKYRTDDKDRDPTATEMRRDSQILTEELTRVDPEFIITLGRISTRHFLGDVDMDVVHGIPHPAGRRWVLPCFHPAAGLHNTEAQALIQYDFQAAAAAIKGPREAPPMDHYTEPTYWEAHCPADLRHIKQAVDTEGSYKKPWCLTATDRAGNAGMTQDHGSKFGHIILHNSLHDLPVLRAMDTTFQSFDDTMVMAYLLCVEPQGLKQLAKRHCGMEMHSYPELTDPYRLKKQLAWMEEALKCLDNLSLQDSSTPIGTAPPRKKVKPPPTPPTAGPKSGSRSKAKRS